MEYMYNTFSKRAVGIKKHAYLSKHDELEKKPGKALVEQERRTEQKKKFDRYMSVDAVRRDPNQGLTPEESKEVRRRVEADEVNRMNKKIAEVTWDSDDTTDEITPIIERRSQEALREDEAFARKESEKRIEATKSKKTTPNTPRDEQMAQYRRAAEAQFGALEKIPSKKIQEFIENRYPGFEIDSKGHITRQPLFPWKRQASSEPVFQALIDELQTRFESLPTTQVTSARLPEPKKGFFSRLFRRE